LTYPTHYHSERHRNHCAAATPATTSPFVHQPPAMHHHAVLVKTPPALPTDTVPTSSSTSTLNEVSLDILIAVEVCQQQMLEGFCSLPKLPMPTRTMAQPSLPPHQADFPPKPPTQTTTPVTAPRREPVDLNLQTRRNMDNAARRSPSKPTPQPPTQQIPLFHPPDPHQTVSSPTHPLTSHNQQTAGPIREPIDHDATTRSSPRNIPADDRSPSVSTAIEESIQPLEPVAQNLAATHSNTPSPHTHLIPSHKTTPATAHSMQPQLSMTARMILNNTRPSTTLWTPNALQSRILIQTMEFNQFHPSPDPVHSPPLP